MNKATLYTIVISLVVVAVGAIMVVCGQIVNKDGRKFKGEMLNIMGGLIIGFGFTLIPMIGYCVKMSLEKKKARREQSDPNDLDPSNVNPNEYVAVTNHLLQVMYICILYILQLSLLNLLLSVPTNFSNPNKGPESITFVV